MFIFLLLLKKSKSTRQIEHHPSQLNSLFLVGMLGWFIYIFLDSIIYLIAPLSIQSGFEAGIYSGYSLEVPSLFIANILRDFAMAGALLLAWSYFIASFNIKYGQQKTAKIFFKNGYIISIMVVLSILSIIGDRIQVRYIAVDNLVRVNAVWSGLASFGTILTIILLGIGSLLLIWALRVVMKEDHSPKFKRKIMYLSSGIIIFSLGNYYWFVAGYLAEIFIQFFTAAVTRIILHSIGHFIWMISALLILIGFSLTESSHAPSEAKIPKTYYKSILFKDKMNDEKLYWKSVAPGPEVPIRVNTIIECPKGTQNKYEMSKTTNLLKLDRVLHSSVIYPQDYGFIPGTYADDGDPLDILVLITHPTYPLTLLEVKPIGVLLMEDQQGVDEKILAVCEHDPVYKIYDDIVQLPQHYIDEIQEFFRTYKNLEERSYSEVREWKGRDYAHMIINKSVKAFVKKFGDISKINP